MLGFFRRTPRPDTSAGAARDRLQILLAHERSGRTSPEVLPLIQRDILEVIKKHMRISDDSVDITVEPGDDFSTLEINIELPGTSGARRGIPN
ncbi:cell division topological specificity factor MinE [Meridianimarinicoccus aquatilis]|uniref:Cell division topological specificity factor n=1 Tax=Meridianimarinicoccus aquatilis TaxID=2552766 RepID=A0A4R6ASA7_9RHOB|nr:cell division topological specificity factor MinE [Fluviibacterium aquatile]QIE41512.1 cell division topological specificity factor MinE [Rhodobacteraceae bacterium SC52]TDL86452.1 cell division topological specificity factor MinE [Fluviibacterium aquatile]